MFLFSQNWWDLAFKKAANKIEVEETNVSVIYAYNFDLATQNIPILNAQHYTST